jgi:hypothetical protein
MNLAIIEKFDNYKLAVIQVKRNVLFVLLYKFFSACTAKSNNDLKGTCHTPEECGELGGTQDGNCASGFGTCCVI